MHIRTIIGPVFVESTRHLHMHHPRSAWLRLGRTIRRGAPVIVHALVLTAALVSSGVSPVALLSSNEAESSQQETPASEYAHFNRDARTQVRHLASQHGESCTASFDAIFVVTGARASAGSPLNTRLSSGLSIPLRC